jgi:hypothetical protein
VAQLWKEELEFFVGELAKLRAEDIVDANMVCISPMGAKGCCISVVQSGEVQLCTAVQSLGGEHLRKILNTERWIFIKVVALKEPFKKIPTHLGCVIGKSL